MGYLPKKEEKYTSLCGLVMTGEPESYKNFNFEIKYIRILAKEKTHRWSFTRFAKEMVAPEPIEIPGFKGVTITGNKGSSGPVYYKDYIDSELWIMPTMCPLFLKSKMEIYIIPFRSIENEIEAMVVIIGDKKEDIESLVALDAMPVWKELSDPNTSLIKSIREQKARAHTP